MGHIAHLNNNRHDKISSGELKRSTLTLSIIFITFLHSFGIVGVWIQVELPLSITQTDPHINKYI